MKTRIAVVVFLFALTAGLLFAIGIGSSSQTPQQYLQSLFPGITLHWTTKAGISDASVQSDALQLAVAVGKTTTAIAVDVDVTQLANLTNQQAVLNRDGAIILQAAQHYTGYTGAFNVITGLILNNGGGASGPNHVSFIADVFSE